MEVLLVLTEKGRKIQEIDILGGIGEAPSGTRNYV